MLRRGTLTVIYVVLDIADLQPKDNLLACLNLKRIQAPLAKEIR